MLHIEPSRLADDSAFSLGTRIFDRKTLGQPTVYF